VSSRQQATHLKNQREAMEHFCLSAGYRVDEWIMEYGSGMNFKRKKFKNLISRILTGEIECLIVAHKDRLLRFGYDLLSHICQLSRCEIIIANSQSLSPQEELIDDLMAIIHTFSCRLYGLRSYKKKIKAIAKGDEGEVGAQDKIESKS
jgi:predicted site-specific integrase-resolvase